MLSYLHAYHAGNYADVLKHVVLVQVLQYMARKDKPFCYIDTHAGAGFYKLSSKEAVKTGEYQQGIAALWTLKKPPAAVAAYLNCVKQFNRTPELRVYPGSCMIAAQMLRPQDRLILSELHPRETQLLSKTFAAYENVYCYAEDGFSKGLASLPPSERRGVMLIDPSYEVKTDYQRVVEHLQQCYRRFSTGVYLLWYPLVDEQRIIALCKSLRRSGMSRIQQFELGINQDHSHAGMTGTGMMVVNPTFGLCESMTECLPFLAAQLGGNGYWKSEVLVGE